MGLRRIRLRLRVDYRELVDDTGDSVRVRSDQAYFVRSVRPGEVIELRWGNLSGKECRARVSVREVAN